MISIEQDEAPPAPFSDRLKKARETRGWSQGELAGRADTHESSIAHYENGSRKSSSARWRASPIAST